MHAFSFFADVKKCLNRKAALLKGENTYFSVYWRKALEKAMPYQAIEKPLSSSAFSASLGNVKARRGSMRGENEEQERMFSWT
jgi:hypothetical protein